MRNFVYFIIKEELNNNSLMENTTSKTMLLKGLGYENLP
jgi:hypothetical protein